jgi:cytochrome c oxidase subunit 4
VSDDRAVSETLERRRIAPYLRVWAVLLGLTVVMVAVDRSDLRLAILASVLVAAMLAKATLIASYFMHLRSEGKLLVWSVIVGLFVVGVILFVLLIPDGLRIHRMITSP